MKRPIPTLMDCFNAMGIAFMIASRKPVRTRIVMATPSRKTTPMAADQGSFIPATS